MLWWQAVRRSRFGIGVLPLSSGAVMVYAPNIAISIWLVDEGKRMVQVHGFQTFDKVQEWMLAHGHEWNYNWTTFEAYTNQNQEWYGRKDYRS